MRLINVKTGQLEEHTEPPPYAILSHRWESEEVTIGQYTSSSTGDTQGLRKIRAFINELQNDSHLSPVVTHIWVDTCCIDKTSSAELSEAINSMYDWYKNAVVCFAYLSDVESGDELEKSAWFTRGWTLQELLAPSNVRFYNKHWKHLGVKQELTAILSRATGISPDVLTNDTRISECSVAQRLSWAADRRTTRIEDRAYSLMGLFEINMPMLYGEGEKAFHRLQQEIIRESDDQSIFAWRLRPHTVTLPAPITAVASDQITVHISSSLIARSIDQFADCQRIQVWHSPIRPSSYALTNIGLSINLLVLPWTMHVYVGFLNCADNSDLGQRWHCIFLRRIDEQGQFGRVTVQDRDRALLSTDDLNRLFNLGPKIPVDGLKILVRHRQSGLPLRTWHYGFRLEPLLTTHNDQIPSDFITIYRRIDNKLSDPALLLLPEGDNGTVATFLIHDLLPYNKVVYVRLGFDFNFLPVVLVTLETKLELDASGFVRPRDPRFRVEKGCTPHIWLREIVENDSNYFANSANTLLIKYLDRPSYVHEVSEHVQIKLLKDLKVDDLVCWSLSVRLNLDSLRTLTGMKMQDLSDNP